MHESLQQGSIDSSLFGRRKVGYDDDQWSQMTTHQDLSEEDEKVRIISQSPLFLILGMHCLQAETINCLLKKRFGMRNRQNPLVSVEDRIPATQNSNGTPAESEEESGDGAAVPTVEVVLTCYR